MLNNIFLIKLIPLAIIAILILVKTFLFANIRDHKKIAEWFHFNIYHIVNSPTIKLEKAKKLQNALTSFIGVTVALTAILFYLVK